MKSENEQFFDGFLLGALVIGLIIVTFITFFLYQNARTVGEGDTMLSERIVEVQPLESTIRNEAGQSVMLNQKTYTITHAFSDNESDLTYRSLSDEKGDIYASIWAQNGEQLLYAPEIPILDAMGVTKASVISIQSEKELLLMSPSEELFIFDLSKGLVKPWKN